MALPILVCLRSDTPLFVPFFLHRNLSLPLLSDSTESRRGEQHLCRVGDWLFEQTTSRCSCCPQDDSHSEQEHRHWAWPTREKPYQGGCSCDDRLHPGFQESIWLMWELLSKASDIATSVRGFLMPSCVQHFCHLGSVCLPRSTRQRTQISL